MRSVSKKSATNKKAARDRRILARARREDGGKPLPAGRIAEAAERAGINPTRDGTMVTVMRGDLATAAKEIRGAFDDVLAAELSEDAAQHDVLVLQALRRLRNARDIVQGEIGGAS